ncbi:MAG: hypothetical protein JJT77_01335 [Crocinitomicaceae bacterium]|nr:hypothetical protein [Crocinitomicaceae bacterium]
MKVAIAFGLLSLLFLPMWGSLGYLQLEKKKVQKSVKRKMMKGIPKEELIYMAFSTEDLSTKLNWKHSKEFELNGEMYDIVERKETADSAFYWVWWDKEETELNQRVKRIATEIFGSSPDQQEKNNVVQSFYKSLFFENQNNDFPFLITSQQRLSYHYLDKTPSDYHSTIDTPPWP